MQLCRHWLHNRLDWNCVVFSDEKKFSIDGPDNMSSYTRQGHRRQQIRAHSKGGSIMMWAMSLPVGVIFAKRIYGRQTSEHYKAILSSYAVPWNY